MLNINHHEGEIIMRYGHLIKKHRLKARMTQEELAEGICSTQHLYRIENGKRLPSLYLFDEISKKLGNDLVRDLFG